MGWSESRYFNQKCIILFSELVKKKIIFDIAYFYCFSKQWKERERADRKDGKQSDISGRGSAKPYKCPEISEM